MKLYVIITLLVVLLIILFYNVYNESFIDLPKPVTQNTPVRVDFTCPSSDQKNIFDRFEYARKTISNVCPADYTKQPNYFGLSNICLPNCLNSVAIIVYQPVKKQATRTTMSAGKIRMILRA